MEEICGRSPTAQFGIVVGIGQGAGSNHLASHSLPTWLRGHCWGSSRAHTSGRVLGAWRRLTSGSPKFHMYGWTASSLEALLVYSTTLSQLSLSLRDKNTL